MNKQDYLKFLDEKATEYSKRYNNYIPHYPSEANYTGGRRDAYIEAKNTAEQLDELQPSNTNKYKTIIEEIIQWIKNRQETPITNYANNVLDELLEFIEDIKKETK